ncbi:MAG: hypothetical protein AB1489_35580 [Acidobacteriota bacterium]
MTNSRLPNEIKNFILEHINSFEQLEVLFLLYRSARKESLQTEWTVDAIARELRTNPKSVATRLLELHAHGLISARGETAPLYCYNPSTPDLDNVVKNLEEIYEQYKVTVLNLIFSKPLDNIRTFADAFRISKEKE